MPTPEVTRVESEDIMKRVDEYITEKEVKQFCENCYELCSRHCIIWRKAEMRYNEDAKKEKGGLK